MRQKKWHAQCSITSHVAHFSYHTYHIRDCVSHSAARAYTIDVSWWTNYVDQLCSFDMSWYDCKAGIHETASCDTCQSASWFTAATWHYVAVHFLIDNEFCPVAWSWVQLPVPGWIPCQHGSSCSRVNSTLSANGQRRSCQLAYPWANQLVLRFPLCAPECVEEVVQTQIHS